MSMMAASHKRHRFPPALIAHAVWLYLRFSLSLRAIEEMLLERGVEVSHETLRRWIVTFGPKSRLGPRRDARPGPDGPAGGAARADAASIAAWADTRELDYEMDHNLAAKGV